MMDKATSTVYQIGEVAKITDLSLRTIRYYEEIGLLNSVKRIDHGRRVYTDADIRRLKFVKKLKLLGLSLSEMLELEKIYLTHQTNAKVLPELINLLDRHTRRVDERIDALKKLKKEICEFRGRMEGKLKEEIQNKGKQRRLR